MRGEAELDHKAAQIEQALFLSHLDPLTPLLRSDQVPAAAKLLACQGRAFPAGLFYNKSLQKAQFPIVATNDNHPKCGSSATNDAYTNY